MAASRATWALALVLIAACSMPSALAGVWGSYYSGGCGGFPSYSDCDGGWTCDGSNCLGKCTYGGYATATCMNGQWHVNVTCNAAPKKCSTLPPSCEGITWTSDCYNKDKAYAYCGNGYTGVVSATCVNGEWVLSGQCTKIISIPKPKTCAGTPPACEGANWVCDGYKCWGYCSNDYCGVVTAHCWDGQWVVEGYCRKVTYFPPKPKACSGMPPSCTGASWTCTDSKCYGFCGNGYTGSVNAYCWNGEWVVSGSCQKITYVPPTQPTCGCAGLPPAVSGISWSPRCDGKSYCGANCMNGYCEGYVYSKCVNGVWSTPVGSCTPAIAVAPKKCHGKPKKQCNAYNWKCHHGKYCKAKCKWGCSGKGYKAKCEDGKWVVSGGCKQAWWSFRSEEHY